MIPSQGGPLTANDIHPKISCLIPLGMGWKTAIRKLEPIYGKGKITWSTNFGHPDNITFESAWFKKFVVKIHHFKVAGFEYTH